MGKLAEIAVETCSLFLEVAANLGLEPRVGGARHLTSGGRVQLEARVVGLSRVEERSVRVDGVGHSELLRGVELLPNHKVRHLLADVKVPEGRVGLVVKEVVEVLILPQGVHALESTWSGVEALGHDAVPSGGGASLRAGPAEAWEDVFSFEKFEH